MVPFWLSVCLWILSLVPWLSSLTRKSGPLPRLLLVGLVLMMMAVSPVPVYAAPFPSTPSDAERDRLADQFEEMMEDGSYMDFVDDLLLRMALLSAGDVSFLGPVLSTPSDAAVSDPALLEAVAGDVVSCDPVPFALSADESVVNVLCYPVRINGTAYDLYLPPEYLDQIYIDGDSQVWNVGTNSISGRLFPNGFSATSTTGYLVTLGPCLGNNFSSNRNYGSPNYMRRYYWSGNSLTYDTTYIRIYLDGDTAYPFRVSDTLKYVIIFLIGGVLICLWKRSSR